MRNEIPMRAETMQVPALDPLIYRFTEMVSGPARKMLIEATSPASCD